jgi:hypothetical protein
VNPLESFAKIQAQIEAIANVLRVLEATADALPAQITFWEGHSERGNEWEQDWSCTLATSEARLTVWVDRDPLHVYWHAITKSLNDLNVHDAFPTEDAVRADLRRIFNT